MNEPLIADHSSRWGRRRYSDQPALADCRDPRQAHRTQGDTNRRLSHCTCTQHVATASLRHTGKSCCFLYINVYRDLWWCVDETTTDKPGNTLPDIVVTHRSHCQISSSLTGHTARHRRHSPVTLPDIAVTHRSHCQTSLSLTGHTARHRRHSSQTSRLCHLPDPKPRDYRFHRDPHRAVL